MVRAMARIIAYETPLKLLPAVEKFFQDIAPLQKEPLREILFLITLNRQ